MNENQTTDAGIPDTKTKPGKLWLWGLAVFQLLAVFLMSWVGVNDAMIKLCGFTILILCGRMDINAMKKVGYQVPYWWWGLACFLPPVYMILRVLKTDTAPSERVKRFAPAIVWGVLMCMYVILGSMSAIAEENAALEEHYRNTSPAPARKSAVLDLSMQPPQYQNAWAKEMLQNSLSEEVEDSVLKLDGVSDVVLVGKNGNTYKWVAKVKLSTRMGRPASAVMTYDLSYDNESDLLQFSIFDDDNVKLNQLVQQAME